MVRDCSLSSPRHVPIRILFNLHLVAVTALRIVFVALPRLKLLYDLGVCLPFFPSLKVSHDVLVVQLAEEVDLTQNALPFCLLGPVWHLNLFDCVDAPVEDVSGFEHHAEGTFSNLTNLLKIGLVATHKFLLLLDRDVIQSVIVFGFRLFTHCSIGVVPFLALLLFGSRG